ncbi:hypothetical protein [Amycolatopsis sp. lyj-90]|uniref:hypothetical protein n=1 Tax=Amycolatopsis sp. lyj-90 TaxID=2789285 RepID=UPI0039791DAA
METGTYQDDDGRWRGIYRWRSFPELPVGSAHGGGLIFQRLDESVLAFTDPGAVDHSPWNTARRIRQLARETPDV